MPPVAPKKPSLLTLRFIWAVLLLGQFIFAVITMVVIWPSHNFAPNPVASQKLTIMGVIMMLVLLPLAFVIRRLVYRPGADGTVTLANYSTGNIIFYALCESVAFTGMIAMLLHGGPGGEIIIPAIAVALQIVNYPNGNVLSPPVAPMMDGPLQGR